MSFSLGRPKSYLWIVTKDQLSLRMLPPESELQSAARDYARAVEQRLPADKAGQQLSAALFGELPASVQNKPEWLLVGEGALLDGVPFGSLPEPAVKEGPAPLVAQHSLRFLPSELLLAYGSHDKPERRFLGVGDPIYNTADPRHEMLLKPVALASRRVASTALSRLPASDRDVRTAARESGMPQTEILVGARATLTDLQRAVTNRPEIVHFAVHVVSPESEGSNDPTGKPRAALALSLTRDDIPELLTSEAIATLRVPGSLVILSGCSSQKGEVLPGAGLMGLSRAWLLAGASAVVVSAWPTPDDSGSFFSTFYRFLQSAPAGSLAQRAAFALQKAQITMQHGGGYRSLPKFWAAYSIVSKE
jgi:CHAT domain-containing protein